MKINRLFGRVLTLGLLTFGSLFCRAANAEPTLIARVAPIKYFGLDLSPNERWLLLDSKGKIILYDVRSGARRSWNFRYDSDLSYPRWTPDNRILTFEKPLDSSSDALLITSHALNGAALLRFRVPAFKAPRDAKMEVALQSRFSPDGREFWLLSSRTLRAFDARNGRLLRSRRWGDSSTPYFGSWSFGALLSKDGRTIMCAEKQITVYDARSGRRVRRFGGAVKHVFSTGDSDIVASIQNDVLKFWNIRNGQALWTQNASVRNQSHGTMHLVLASTGLEWRDQKTGRLKQRLVSLRAGTLKPWPPTGIVAVEVSRDNRLVYSLDYDGRILRWRAK